MYSGKLVFAQLMELLPLYQFQKCVQRYQGDNTAYAFDSTTIDLCLSLFPWARFQKNKGAIKLHTLLNLRGNIPEFIYITEGKIHDAIFWTCLFQNRALSM